MNEEERALREADAGGDLKATLSLGYLLEDRGETDAALEQFRKADAAGILNGTGNLARLLQETGRLDEAEAAFKRCADAGSDRALAQYIALLVRRGAASQDDISALVKFWCSHSDHVPRPFNPDLLEGEAREAYLAALAAMDTLSDLWQGDAGNFQILESICNPDHVVAALEEADAGGSLSASHELAIHYVQQQDPKQAADAFERTALRGWTSSLIQAAAARLQAGDPHRGLALGERAVEEDVFGGHWVVGVIQRDLGNHQASVEAYVNADEAGDARGAFEIAKLHVFVSEQAGSSISPETESQLIRAAEAGVDGAVELLEKARGHSPQ
jgi:tetratricopeptide (TPR) repeat protein